MKFIRFSTVGLLMAGLFIMSPVWAAKLEKTVKKSEALSASHLLVKSHEGTVKVSCGDNGKVMVYADIEVKAKDKEFLKAFTEQVDIVFEQDGDQLMIKPEYPKLKKGEQFLQWKIGKKKPTVKVSYKIVVPRTLNVTVKTEKGDIEIDRICGEVKATSNKGSITANIQNLQSGCKHVYQSMSGELRVHVPQHVKADVNMNTLNGQIHTDYSPVSGTMLNPNAMNVKVNGGGESVILKTYDGAIYLFKNTVNKS